MKKRILSILLTACIIFGAIPAGTAYTADYERWGNIIRMGWDAESDTWAWETFTDHDDPTLERQYTGSLPEGSSFDSETNTLTLSDVSFSNLVAELWGDTPLKIVISGEVTISGEHRDALPSLLIDGSSQVTVCGKAGDGSDKLNLYSDKTHALRLGCYKPYVNDDEGWLLTDSNGLLTVENLTLSAVSDYPEDACNSNSRGMWTAISLSGNTAFKNANVTADGYYGIDAFGGFYCDYSTITTSNMEFTSLEKRFCEGDAAGGYETESYIKNSIVTISMDAENRGEDPRPILLVSRSVLTIDGNSKVTVDTSKAHPTSGVIHVTGHHELRENGPESGIRMNGGTLDVILQPSHRCEGVIAYFDPICIHDGAKWLQSGGDVKITMDAGAGELESHAFTVDDGSVFNLSGGSFTVDNICDEVPQGIKAMAVCGWEKSSLNFSGGTFTATGAADDPYDVAVWVYGEMAVTGDAELNLKGNLQTDSQQSHIEIFGGTVNINSIYEAVNIGSALSIYGGKMNLNAPGHSEGIYAYQGNVRFLGGEVNITAGSALTWQSRKNQMTFGEGIKAAFPDGTEATVKELYYGDSLIGWATDTDYIYEDFGSTATQTVIIKKQGVKADTDKASISFDLTNTASLVAGVPINFRIIPTITEASDTLSVSLPSSLLLHGVTVNNEKVTPEATASGFEIPVNNGDIIRFTATPNAVGKVNVSASVEGAEKTLELDVGSYSLSMPSTVKYTKFTVFGTAVPLSTVTFYEITDNISTPIGTATANAAGAWKAEIELDGAKSTYSVYATVTAGDEQVATTERYRITYDATRAVVETLKITNTIHGATIADPDEEVSVTLNYIDGTRSQNYYIYWPELPEFKFEAKFSGEKSTPEYISGVAVIATDCHGEETRVPLSYDKKTGLWCGTHNFCDVENIVPDSFRVVWSEYGVTEQESTEDIDMPSAEEAPPEYDKDYTTGAFTFADAGSYSIPLADGAVISAVTDVNGNAVEYSVDNDICEIAVESGEFYTVTLEQGSFAEPYGKYSTLYIICSGNAEPKVTYRDEVIKISLEDLEALDSESMTFTCSEEYSVNDVILIDEDFAITVTEANGTEYRFRNSDIDEIYKTLDISTVITDNIEWEVDGEELAKEFMASPLFEGYVAAIEATLSDEYEIGDHNVEVDISASADTDGVITLNATITVTTEATTSLPLIGEQETTIVTVFENEVSEDIDFRVRFDTETEKHSVYFAVSEAATSAIDINVTVGEEEGEGTGLDKYFEMMEGDVEANFLEALKEEADKEADLTFAKLSIPTPITSVLVYIEPSLEINWGFFGELTLGTKLTQNTKSGLAATYIDGEWITATFADREDPHFTANAKLHLTSSIETLLRVDAGLSVLRVFDLGVYAKAGPRLSINGHGSASYDSTGSGTGWDAELFARLTLEAEGGAHVALGFGKIKLLEEDLPLYSASKNIAEIGWDQMPTRFATVEAPPSRLMPSEYDIVERINIAMMLQSFNGATGGTKVYDENNYERYTFEVEYGPVHITGSGEYARLIVDDLLNPCNYGIRITFKSNYYELFKVVPLCYEPGCIDVFVSAEEEPPIAGIEIIDLNRPGRVFSGSTDSSGYYTVVVGDGEYSVAQTSAPARNYLASESPIKPVIVQLGGTGIASFDNKLIPEQTTNDFPLPGSGDPSGYVFEGIDSNRLEGVKTTLYYKPTENSEDVTVWDASAFDQDNPLVTDKQGQYLWMVPSGWWQVKYELEGYNDAYSEWMEVPPIRTGVNVNLTSDAPATMQLEYSEYKGVLLMRFDRPVKVSKLHGFSLFVDGEPYEGYYELLDIDTAWSATDLPEDSEPCATTFRIWTETDVRGKRVDVTLESVETYNGTTSAAEGGTDVPEATYTVSFSPNGGNGSMDDVSGVRGEYTLPECAFMAPEGEMFKSWDVNGEEKAAGDKITVNNDITVIATWQNIPGYTLSGVITVFGNKEDGTGLELIPKGESTPAYTLTVGGDISAELNGNQTEYCFTEVKEGEYILRISKTKHTVREAEIIISQNTELNLSLRLYGDVNNDGKVNATDATQIKRYYNNKTSVFATAEGAELEYLLKAADVNGDGKANATDATQIKRYYNNKLSVFNTIP